MTTSWTLAVDFGTTNTSATVAVDGGPPQRVRLSSSGDAMPSAVLVDDSGIRVGSSALHARRVRPEGFVEAPKTLLGSESTHVAGSDHAVADLVGQVFAHVTRAAVRVAGHDRPDRVVLTHPQDWAARRRDALVAAWDASGMETSSLMLVSEPVAAASWLVSRPQVRLTPGARIAVVDYGGGTCDVSVLEWTDDPGRPWRELGSAGAPRVGGMAVDQSLLSWVREALHRRGKGGLEAALAAPENIAALRTLLDEVRQAKEVLSEVDHADIPIAVAGESTWVSITADEFEAVVAGEIAKVRGLTERALEAAELAGTDLDTLFLTGGSSLMRPVHAAMSEVLGQRPATLEDPKLVVALGAHLAASREAAARPEVDPGASTMQQPSGGDRPEGAAVATPSAPRSSPPPAGGPPDAGVPPGAGEPTAGHSAAVEEVAPSSVEPAADPPSPRGPTPVQGRPLFAAFLRISAGLAPAWLTLAVAVAASDGNPENSVVYVFVALIVAGVCATAALSAVRARPGHQMRLALLSASVGLTTSVVAFASAFATSSNALFMVWAFVMPLVVVGLVALAVFRLPPISRRLASWAAPASGTAR